MTQLVDEYIEFSNKVNEYISAIMLSFDLNVASYSSEIIENEIVGEKAKIWGYPFPGLARQRFSGMVYRDEFETSIVYNSNMSRKRINFTIAHEIIHFLYHINQENHTFFDTRETLKLTDEDYLVEFQANVGASAILLPDSVLIFELKQGTKPSEISDKYGISESAFSRRLTQTMEAEFAASHDAAYRTTMKIMNKYGNAGKSTMMELGRNLERKIVYANPFYEALII